MKTLKPFNQKPMHTQYQTKPIYCDYMVQLAEELIGNDTFIVFEPTPGQCNLVRALSNSEKVEAVIAPDDYFIHKQRTKMYFDDLKGKYPIIVANPPFSSPSVNVENAPEEWQNLKGMAVGYKFLEEFMEQSDNLVVLVPWFTISDSDVRFRKIREFGLISVTPLPRKAFDYARIQTVILQMQKGYTGETKFHTHLI